jgi:hypothetical protein
MVFDMIRIIIGAFACFLHVVAFAQGNLQFNQVKLVTAQETVPIGKVWKVESVIYNIPEDLSGAQTSASTTCSSSTFRSTAIEVDGVPTKVGLGTNTASYSNLTYTHTYTMLPLWLPAGATLSGGSCLNKVSVLEFSVVP